MTITTHIDFNEDRFFDIDKTIGVRELSEKTIELLEGFRPGQTLILKDRVSLARTGKNHGLSVSSKVDGVFFKVDEKADEILNAVSDEEVVNWAKTLIEKTEMSDMENMVAGLSSLKKKDIFTFILDNNSKGNLQIRNVTYSVRGSKLTIRIECETSMFAKASRTKALSIVNETLLSGPEEERILYYAPIYYHKQVEFIKQLLIQGKTAWIPMDQPEAHAILAFLYLNALNLRQILLVETSNIYKLQYVNGVIEGLSQEVEPDQDRPSNIDWESMSNYTIPPVYQIRDGSLLGCFSHFTCDQASSLKNRFKNIDTSGGGYIFLCPFTIKEFKDDLWKNSTRGEAASPSPYQKVITDAEVQGVENELDLLYKLVFLHEMGHLCCYNTSKVVKQKGEETLANWIASMNVALFEREYILLKTNHQPPEYWDFITLPYYGINGKTPGIAQDADSYKTRIVNLLKKTSR